MFFHEKKLNSRRNIPNLRLSQFPKKVHSVNCLSENSRKKWIVTDCYVKIVTKAWTFTLIHVVRASCISLTRKPTRA